VPGGYRPQYGGGEEDGFLAALPPSGRPCYGTYTGSTARALLEGVALADSETVLYAVGTVNGANSKELAPAEPERKIRDVCGGTGDTKGLSLRWLGFDPAITATQSRLPRHTATYR